MTISFTSNDFRNQFTSTGTGPFSVTIKFTDVTDLKVIKTSTSGVDTTLTNVTDYSITPTATGTGSGYTGGSLTLGVGLVSGEKLTVLLNKSFEQTQDYRNSSAFPADDIERGLDSLTVLLGQNRELFARSLTVPSTSLITNTVIKDAGASKVISVDSDGLGFTALDPSSLSLSGSLTPTLNNFIVGNGSTWLSVSASSARASLGLGTIATQSSSSVNITGGSITGITDLAVADGGTGASNSTNARTNLGLTIGTNVQAYDATLDAISNLSATGIVTQTAADTFTGRSLSAGSGLSWSNASGTTGNPTISYNISGLSEELSPSGTTDITLLDRSGTVKYIKLGNIPSSAAPVSSTFVTMSSDATLTNERVLTAGSGITLTDGGANSTATLSVNINGLTNDASPDTLNDYLMTYDASAGTNKKVLLSNVAGTSSGNWISITSTAISGSPSAINFTSVFSSTYDAYMFVGSGVTASTNTATISFKYSENAGGSWITTNLKGNLLSTNSSTSTLTNSNTNNANITQGSSQAVGFIFTIANPTNSGGKIAYQCRSASSDGTNGCMAELGGLIANTAAVNGIQFLPSTGTFSSGTITLYGLKYT